MLDLKEGTNYLVMTKAGQIYFGEFVGCEMQLYAGSKRKVDVFKNVYAQGRNDPPLLYNYLYLLPRLVADVTEAGFGKAKFLNTPKTELSLCFERGGV